jgi:hypothetical protein
MYGSRKGSQTRFTEVYKISLGALFSQIAFKNLFHSKHFSTQWGVGISGHYLKKVPFSDKQPSRFLWGMEAPIGIAYKKGEYRTSWSWDWNAVVSLVAYLDLTRNRRGLFLSTRINLSNCCFCLLF